MFVKTVFEIVFQFWMYVTWLVKIAPVVDFLESLLFLSCSLLLWHFFLKSWRGDPGIVANTQDQKFRVCIVIDFFLFYNINNNFVVFVFVSN